MVRRALSILLMCAVTLPSFSDDRLPAGALDESVGALTAFTANDRYGLPVLTLGGEEPVIISFDILDPERKYLRYSLTHCDASWKPDMLQPIEFTAGFNEGTIDDYAYSHGTLTQYVNYRLELPNEQVTPIVSGNYLLTVYDESAPDIPLARIPFMVSEQAARIGATVTGRTDYDYNGGHQQLEASVDLTGLDIRDPWNDLRLTIIPDMRLNAAQSAARPIRINGSTATFAHNPALTFTAGNEYRRFETVSTSRYLPMGVEYVKFSDPWYHFKLYTDQPRASQDYRYDQTQFGGFTINADETDDPDTQSEYVKVHFSLDIPEQPDAKVMIEGQLTDRRTDGSSQGVMTFNRVSNMYEAVLTLKQGSYNYQYVLVPADGKMLTAPIEGDDYRTANRYDLAVYYRSPGARYDRLLGFTTIFSGS